jgi:hypothetical protein
VVDNVTRAGISAITSAGGGQTNRWEIETGNSSGAGSHEGPKTPAGSVTMSWSTTNGAWAISAMSLKPAAEGGGGGALPETVEPPEIIIFE